MAANKFFTPTKPLSLQELVHRFNLKAGPGFVATREVSAMASLKFATRNDLTFFDKKTPDDTLIQTKAGACIVSHEMQQDATTLPNHIAFLLAEDPHLAFAKIQQEFYEERHPPNAEVSPQAAVSLSAILGADVFVGEHAVIGAQAVIGDRTQIHPGVVIGAGVHIGADSVIFPNCSIICCTIGERCVLHSGVQVGSRGYGYLVPDPVPPQGLYPAPHIGEVVIEDDVEIGALSVIVRATIDKTHIKRGVKIDGHCFLAHNVIVGSYSAIFGGVSIAGSTEIGSGVIIMGRAAVAGHLKIGDRAKIGGMAAVTRSVPPGAFVTGNPALPLIETRRMFATLRQLTRQNTPAKTRSTQNKDT
ncbi:MAG: UDP-3-O-(3-hydroxymyristoyl)glucosamine N-acyltransferase [Alphaproteobacteria bacterium]